jgi:hypothetical protein
MSSAAIELTECLNCHTALHGPYCATCGQKATSPRPTVHDFFHDAFHEFLHFDGKILQSVRLLLTRPGFLTSEYVEGRRIRYISPLRLYLIFSVAYFAAATLMAKPPIVTDQDRAAATGWQRPEEFGRIRVSGDFSRYGLTPEEVAERIRHAQHDWVPRVMFVLVPIAALVVMAVTRRTRRTYIEHLYFALHVHAMCFAMLALAIVIGEPAPPTVNAVVTAIAVLLIVAYVIAAIRTTYGGGWILSIGRAAAALFVYGGILVGTVIAIFIGAIVT